MNYYEALSLFVACIAVIMSSIRMLEGVDQLLYAVGRIKKLPKPKYPGGKRV